jgi:YbgC/YbaW family acyl-CoA thioester hydrolase
MAFEHKMRVRFQDTDPAGIVFFANIFVYCHEAFEEMLRSFGLPLEEIIGSREQTLPLGHAEADFKRPFRAGVMVTIRVAVARIGDRSFTLEYQMYDEPGHLLATAQTVHVAVDPRTGHSMPVAPRLRTALERHHVPS